MNNYELHNSAVATQFAISEVIKKEIVLKIKLSSWYSFQVNENTDISEIQSINVYAKYLIETDGKPCVATTF